MIVISAEGDGNAPNRRVPPTTAGVDAYVKTSLLAVGEPGGVAPIFVEVGNLGQDFMIGASVTVSLTGGLTFVGSNPAPDPSMSSVAGAPPPVAVTWSIPELAFQGVGRIVLYVQVPEVEVGKRFVVGVSLNAPSDLLPENNEISLRVMAARQVLMPELMRQ
ncbi:MAG: hypothetical protein IPK16_00270 [Anaerolineales bacterium]|nr:hypothetical protein [Anaerolineales bacterium]